MISRAYAGRRLRGCSNPSRTKPPSHGRAEVLSASTAHGPEAGKLADNVVHFARVLRRAGLPVGTDRALLALQALQVAGLGSRAELYAVLSACLIDRVEQRALFDQAFHVF